MLHPIDESGKNIYDLVLVRTVVQKIVWLASMDSAKASMLILFGNLLPNTSATEPQSTLLGELSEPFGERFICQAPKLTSWRTLEITSLKR